MIFWYELNERSIKMSRQSEEIRLLHFDKRVDGDICRYLFFLFFFI